MKSTNITWEITTEATTPLEAAQRSILILEKIIESKILKEEKDSTALWFSTHNIDITKELP